MWRTESLQKETNEKDEKVQEKVAEKIVNININYYGQSQGPSNN